MDPSAERHMRIGVPGDVQRIRLAILSGVTVGGGQDDQHTLRPADGLAAEFEILSRDTWRSLYRSVVAQEFLRRFHDEGGVSPEPFPLVGVTHEGERAIADEIDRGLMTGDQQQDEIAYDLIP